MSQTYRQITRKLRLTGGVSERPSKMVKGYRVYADEGEPTLVTFDAKEAVNIPFLLSMGAIVEYKPPTKKEEKEVPIGEIRRTSL